jgi:hypothetical protein
MRNPSPVAEHRVNHGAHWRSEEWKPSLRLSLVWTLLGLLVVAVGIAVFGLATIVLAGGVSRLAGLDSLWGILLILTATLVLHELMHAAAMMAFGARPRFGVALVQRVMPVVYCTAPGFWFTRNQFLVVSAAPIAVLSIAGLLLMPIGDLADWLVVPLALNLGGAIGDIWFIGLLLSKSGRTMVEDLQDGLRFHYPARIDARDKIVEA